ncbi:parkin co-regulated protein-domain-containing protein [Pelagophyceae sp. CCMP2097]|nr:parkin co-regulated protein-domain-containing protein [Pelagophyceae sp. CCMP2097]
MADESAVRAEMWRARRQAPPPARAPQGPTFGAKSGDVARSTSGGSDMPQRSMSRPVVSRTASRSKPAIEAAEAKPLKPRGFSSIPSESLPQRLGLGKVNDSGGGKVKGRTRFASSYCKGEVGQWIRVCHRGATPQLGWVVPIESVPLQPLLSLCFAGLSETTHPLCMLARRGATELLSRHPDIERDVPALLPELVPLLRGALACKEVDVVQCAIDHIAPLARVAKGSLLPHLDKLLGPLARKAFGSSLSASVMDALRESQAGVLKMGNSCDSDAAPGSRPACRARAS